jgi:serpin B
MDGTARRRWSVVLTAMALAAAGCGEDAVPRAGDPVADASAASDATAPPTELELPPGADLVAADTERATAGASDDEVAEAAKANLAFAVDLYKVLAAEGDGNLALGPHSISVDLAMVLSGARGETADEMAEVLHLAPGSDPGPALNALDLALRARNREAVEIAVANQVWGQRGWIWREDFAEGLARNYGSPLAATDFGDPDVAREAINAWVAEQTRGHIAELFPAGTIDESTRLVLVNAMYLRAQWFFPFNPDLTADQPFTRADGSTVSVPTMHFNEYLPSARGEGWSAVELPYSGDELSMVVIVPDDLPTFEEDLDPDGLGEVFEALRDGGIHLALPRFEVRTHSNLNEPLRALGMVSAFDGADFSGMTEDGDLSVGTVEHEAYVKVDEEGTEAAAATGTAMEESHGPTVTVDRPFLFAVRDQATGAVLFLGRVTDPSAR